MTPRTAISMVAGAVLVTFVGAVIHAQPAMVAYGALLGCLSGGILSWALEARNVL